MLVSGHLAVADILQSAANILRALSQGRDVSRVCLPSYYRVRLVLSPPPLPLQPSHLYLVIVPEVPEVLIYVLVLAKCFMWYCC